MNKILKAIVLFFAAVFAAYFFLIDAIIKTQIERQGSLALQAPLAIGKATFHLFPTSLALRDIQIGNAHLPAYNLVQADELTLPLSLHDLLAHKFIVDALDIHGLRFNRLRAPADTSTAAAAQSATNSAQLREALQRVQQMLNHPLASNTIDPNASITGAMLADQFKPLLTQITTALNTFVASGDAAFSNNGSDWQILARHINVDGTFDFGSSLLNNNNSLRFIGSVDNVTPQPKLFDVTTQFELRNADGENATLHVTGHFDKRKLAQAVVRFDLGNFALAQWPLSNDPELKIIVVDAKTNIQALLSLTGNQFDFNALTHFEQAHFDIATGNNEVARVVADVFRRSNAFDIDLQASGALNNPVLKLNSNLDVPLAAAIQQLPSPALSPQTPFAPAP